MAENVLRFDFLARDNASATFDKLARKSDDLGSRVGRFAKLAGSALVGVGTAAAGLAAAGAVMGVKTAAGLEQAQIGFTSLLGSGQKAQAFLGQLKTFAAATPFELPGLVDSSRLLIGVGVDTKTTMGILQDFGDAAGAVGVGQENFQRIMLATSQAIGAGRFQTADLNQITENGIPIWTELAKATGKSIPDLRELASKGKLLAADVLPLLQKQMHQDYGGAMAAQSRTLNGLWSTFMDTLNLGLASAIQPMIPALKNGLAGATKVASAALAKLPDVLNMITGRFRAFRGFAQNMAGTFRSWGGLVLLGIRTGFRDGDWSEIGRIAKNGLSTALSGISAKLPSIDLGPLGASFQKQAKDWAGLIILGIQTGLQTGDWSEIGRILGNGLIHALGALGAMGARFGKAVGDVLGSIDWLVVGKAVGRTAAPFAIGFVNTLLDGLFTAIRQHPLDVLLFALTLIPVGKFATAFGPLREAILKLPLGRWLIGLLDRTAAPVFDGAVRLIRTIGRGIVKGFAEVLPESQGVLRNLIFHLGDGMRLRAMYLADRAGQMIEGIGIGIGRMAGKIAFSIRQVIGWETKPFTDAARWLVGRGRDLVVGLARGIGDRIGTVLSAAGRVISRTVGLFRGAGRWLFQAGREILRGLRDGMFDGVTAARSWAANVGGRIVSAVKSYFGIRSPSRMFAGIGRNLITSLFNAMIAHNPVQAVTRIFGGMPEALGALIDKGMVKIASLPGKAMSALAGLGGKFAGLFGGGGGGGGHLGGGLSSAERWIIMHESGGRTNAQNPTSTAFGLGQLLIANRQHYGAILGVSPNTTDYGAQLAMFRMYVRERYGTAENAQRFWEAHHWYGSGGLAGMNGPETIGVGEYGPERVLSARDTLRLDSLIRVVERRPQLVAVPGGDGSGIDAHQLADAMVRAVGRSGITVRMDGRAVGRLQGAQADLLGRAG